MLSALMMLRRVSKAFRYAVREDEFLNVFGARVLLVVIGTVTYTLGAGWNVVDSLYFAVATLTTTSVSDPELVLQGRLAEAVHGLLPAHRHRDPRGDPATARARLRRGA